MGQRHKHYREDHTDTPNPNLDWQSMWEPVAPGEKKKWKKEKANVWRPGVGNGENCKVFKEPGVARWQVWCWGPTAFHTDFDYLPATKSCALCDNSTDGKYTQEPCVGHRNELISDLKGSADSHWFPSCHPPSHQHSGTQKGSPLPTTPPVAKESQRQACNFPSTLKATEEVIQISSQETVQNKTQPDCLESDRIETGKQMSKQHEVLEIFVLQPASCAHNYRCQQTSHPLAKVDSLPAGTG